MKNVLILSSSPRRGGNSDTLCDEFMQGAIESGHRVEKVFLRDKTIHPCTGCGVCSQYKKPCPQKDDAAEIIGKMLAADVIVMATPVYFYAMSAQMKTLIDRCCGPYTEMKNKEFYFIATAAEDDNGIMDRIVANFMGFLDCLENPSGALLPGMVCDVRLSGEESVPAIALPNNAVLIANDGGRFVWKVVDGKAKATPVRTGDLTERGLFILEGLNEDQRRLTGHRDQGRSSGLWRYSSR